MTIDIDMLIVVEPKAGIEKENTVVLVPEKSL